MTTGTGDQLLAERVLEASDEELAEVFEDDEQTVVAHITITHAVMSPTGWR